MDVMEAIKSRKSVRSYLDRPLEDEKLQTVLEAARLAPSASNRQEWRFIVIRDAGMRAKVAAAAKGQSFVGEAPVVIAACAESVDHQMPCGQLSYPMDLAIAIDHMTLAAVELGLGTCWIGAFDEGKIRSLLGIPEQVRVVELLPLGYPEDASAVPKNRLGMDEIVKYERW